jgi:periplasmic divalent cation tolerance protein
VGEEYCVVFVAVGNREESERIACALIVEKLAACCTLLQNARSIYRWKGDICREDEVLMVVKTRRSKFEKVRARIKELHSYEVPEIIALPIVAGHAPYLKWVGDETES